MNNSISKLFKALIAFLIFGDALNAGEIAQQDLSELPVADVVILGETHDNPLHHIGQAAAIKAINPKAVVFEMLTPEQAARVTPSLLADEAALQTALGWNQTSWPSFTLYYPVFAAAQNARIFGAARPKTQVRRAYKDGAATVFGAQAAEYGLDQTLPPEQLKIRKQAQYEAHCEAMPLAMMGSMIEAQRFRDAVFSKTLVQALEITGGPVVLIVGAGHARTDWAVPFMLKQAKPEIAVLSLAFVESPIDETPPYGFWITTEPAPRKDPCLAFK